MFTCYVWMPWVSRLLTECLLVMYRCPGYLDYWQNVYLLCRDALGSLPELEREGGGVRKKLKKNKGRKRKRGVEGIQEGRKCWGLEVSPAWHISATWIHSLWPAWKFSSELDPEPAKVLLPVYTDEQLCRLGQVTQQVSGCFRAMGQRLWYEQLQEDAQKLIQQTTGFSLGNEHHFCLACASKDLKLLTTGPKLPFGQKYPLHGLGWPDPCIWPSNQACSATTHRHMKLCTKSWL